jgi:site-specific DNA-cytosine methylase
MSDNSESPFQSHKKRSFEDLLTSESDTESTEVYGSPPHAHPKGTLLLLEGRLYLVATGAGQAETRYIRLFRPAETILGATAASDTHRLYMAAARQKHVQGLFSGDQCHGEAIAMITWDCSSNIVMEPMLYRSAFPGGFVSCDQRLQQLEFVGQNVVLSRGDMTTRDLMEIVAEDTDSQHSQDLSQSQSQSLESENESDGEFGLDGQQSDPASPPSAAVGNDDWAVDMGAFSDENCCDYDLDYDDGDWANMTEIEGVQEDEEDEDEEASDLVPEGEDVGAAGYGRVDEGAETLRSLELYAGAGGFGHIAGASHGCKLEVGWACECEPWACATYRLNHPRTNVLEMSVGLLLRQVEQWNALLQEYEQYARSLSEWRHQLDCLCVMVPSHMLMPESEADMSTGDDDSDDDFQDAKASLAGWGLTTGTIWRLVAIDKFQAITRQHRKECATIGDDYREQHTLEFLCRLRMCGCGQETRCTCKTPAESRWVDFGSTLPRKQGSDWSEPRALTHNKGKAEPLRAFMAEFVGRCRFDLPMRGSVDLLNGGPPCQVNPSFKSVSGESASLSVSLTSCRCQGFSGHNISKNNAADPWQDPKNVQLKVFCKFGSLLKPRFVLIENVVQLLTKADGLCARHVFRTLLAAGYQITAQILFAGNYGVPQRRPRTLFIAAAAGSRLPRPPLPTHPLQIPQAGGYVVEGVADKIPLPGVPMGMQRISRPMGRTAVHSWHNRLLRPGARAMALADALDELPPCAAAPPRPNGDNEVNTAWPDRWVAQYCKADAPGSGGVANHHALRLSQDDHHRVQKVAARRGERGGGGGGPPYSDWRDLELIEKEAGYVYGDPASDRSRQPRCPSGKPLVPDYARDNKKGKKDVCFQRLWRERMLGTAICRAVPHSQASLHPSEDRVLSVREVARVQGFADDYVFRGSIEDQYKQVGNAVSPMLARALGHEIRRAARQQRGHATGPAV